MTIQRRSPTGTAEFIPPAFGAAGPPNLFGLGAPFPALGGQPPLGPNFEITRWWQDKGYLYASWKLIISDLRGGLGRTRGHLLRDYDRIRASNGVDARFYESLILAQLLTNAATPDPGGSLKGIHFANIFDTMMVGCGATANAAIFKETSASNPALVANTYTPTGSITCFATGVLGGATAAKRLMVGRSGANAAQIVDNADASVVTAMHAATNSLWGAVQTWINTDQWLLYAGTNIYGLAKTAAIAADPGTALLTNVPEGGYHLGIVKLSRAPARVAWVWPFESNTTGMLTFGSEKPGRVVITNLEGTDFHELTTSDLTLEQVYFAILINNGIVVTDKERIVFYDGSTVGRDLRWISDREPNSNYTYECRGFSKNGQELWVKVNRLPASGVTGLNTDWWWEVYDFRTDAWQQVSALQNLSGTGAFGVAPAGQGFPLSLSTGFVQPYIDGSWRRMFVPIYGYNPASLYRKTSDAQEGTGNEYEAIGTLTWGDYELPGLEGFEKTIRRITSLFDVDAGGTGGTPATVQIDAGGDTAGNAGNQVTAIFRTGQRFRDKVAPFANNRKFWYRLRIVWTLTRQSGGTDPTRFTPNSLPVMIEGLARRKMLARGAEWGDANRE